MALYPKKLLLQLASSAQLRPRLLHRNQKNPHGPRLLQRRALNPRLCRISHAASSRLPPDPSRWVRSLNLPVNVPNRADPLLCAHQRINKFPNLLVQDVDWVLGLLHDCATHIHCLHILLLDPHDLHVHVHSPEVNGWTSGQVRI